MMQWLIVFAAVSACASALNVTLLSQPDLQVRLDNNPNGGINVISDKEGVTSIISVIGHAAGPVQEVVSLSNKIVIEFAKNISVSITVRKAQGPKKGIIIGVHWQAPSNVRLADCVNLASSHWYGGPQQKRQYWPIEKLVLPEYSYITKESDNCGVAEPYWLSSSGIFFFFDKKVPLFVDQNNAIKNAACFVAQVKPPYTNKRDRNDLDYVIGIFGDVRQAHEYAVDTILKKPTGYPDERMLTYPVWSTWARYKRDVNHDVVLQFADEINGYGFPNSQFEIDDLWEICYGSQTVDTRRFPDMKNTVDILKEKGFRVTIWTHPFVNKGCEPWYTEAKNKTYLVFSESGSVETSWWNDNGTTSSYIDFTKPEAREWYVNRLKLLQESYGIDSFKFDAGESSWSPQVPVLEGNVLEQPVSITADYVKAVAQFGDLVEVRAGYGTQELPIFVRIIDKDSYWTFENGLPTLITTMLQMNINGYPLVLPDMIGGNGYDGPPDKELFIRWLQANTFMPSLQFSYVPWDFDNETIAISKKFVDMHAQYAPAVIAACQRAVSEGAPINPPVWWIAPKDATAQEIWDEYLLGEDILVAPVVEKGARQRDIYLPAGTWLAQGDPSLNYTGGEWIRNYPAPYLVFSESGSVETSWWNDNGTTSSYIDFTKPEAREWYVNRLKLLQESYGIDSFKFDAGESSWSPQVPVLEGNVLEQPVSITADYVKAVAQFGDLVEVRAGYGTQELPIFVRIIDKDSYWTFENGLPTLITTMLQMNINGYPLVLPDMIGGNGYDGPPDKELFIRWLQANTFMPSLQFSYVPWDFDNETIAISKKFVDMHAQYAPAVIAACQRAVSEGAPINPPVWWIAPKDATAQEIWDEYLLGEDILVAPVVEKGARQRDIYLPAGTWLAQGDPSLNYTGGEWIRNYPAPLDTLPFFVKA